MAKTKFRTIKEEELVAGCAIWFEGRNFLDTSISHPYDGNGRVCGPFLIERVLFGNRMNTEPRVDLVDPATGERRSMMYSWLKVPKEER